MATLTLSDTITAFQREFRVDGEITADHHVGYRFRIGNEALELAGFVQERFGDKPFRRDNPRFWRVTRGILGTTAAEHDADVALYAIVDELATSSSASPADGLVTQDDADLSAHEADTTNVHGIANTSALEGVLADPGASYPATPTVMEVGDRVSEVFVGQERVFEVTAVRGSATTEGASMADLSVDLTPLGVTAETEIDWTYLGVVGELGWDSAPIFPGLSADRLEGLSIASSRTLDDGATMFRLLVAHADPGVSWEATTAYALNDRISATVDGASRLFTVTNDGTTGGTEPAWDLSEGVGSTTIDDGVIWTYLGIVGGPDIEAPVFETKTDGDSDWYLDEDAGAGFRFNIRRSTSGTPATNVQVTPDGFRVIKAGVGTFQVDFDPFAILMIDLPTADPVVAGALWVDVAASRVLKVSAGA